MNTNMLRVLSGVALAGALVAAYVASLYVRAGWQDDGRVREERQLESNWKEAAALDAANDAQWNLLEAQDTYGGTTPNDTWNMFIEALEAGNIELAAKYFRVDKQIKVLDDFTITKKNGHIQKFVEVMKMPKKGVLSADTIHYNFYTERMQETGTGMVFELEVNKQTHVWKILNI